MNTDRLGVLLVRLFCLYLLLEAVFLCTSLPLYWEQYHSMPSAGTNWAGHSFFIASVRVLLQAGAGVWLYQHALDVVRKFTQDLTSVQPESTADSIE